MENKYPVHNDSAPYCARRSGLKKGWSAVLEGCKWQHFLFYQWHPISRGVFLYQRYLVGDEENGDSTDEHQHYLQQLSLHQSRKATSHISRPT